MFKEIFRVKNLMSILAMSMESFDIAFYAYFAYLIFPYFAPSIVTFNARFLVIAIYCICKFIGSCFFGHFADKYGRNNAIVLIISLLSTSFLLMCVLPGYEQIGIFSFIIFICLRCMSGLASGGSSVSLMVFVLEDVPNSFKRRLYGGMLSLGASIGFFVVYILWGLSDPHKNVGISSFDWRWPLSLSFFGFFIAYYFSFLNESPMFSKKTYTNKEWSLIILLKTGKKKLSQVAGMIFLDPIINSVIFGYIPLSLIQERGNLSHIELAFLMSFGIVLFGIFAVLFCVLADRIGSGPLIIFVSFIFITCGWKLFTLVATGHAYQQVSAYLCLVITSSAYFAPAFVIAVETFPTEIRCTGITTAYVIVYTIIAAVSANYIVKIFTNKVVSIRPYNLLLIGAIISSVTAWFIKESRTNQLK